MTETVRQIRINQHRLSIFADSRQLIRQLALHIHAKVSTKLTQQQRFYMALAGGSTPRALYAYLASDESFHQKHWQQFEIFFGDERYVSHDSAESNYRMAREAWLDHVAIPATHIHPVPTHCTESKDCAAIYAQSLMTLPRPEGVPCFDLMLLGMGDDGHTASLFPDTPVLNEYQRWVASVYVPKFNSERITLTYPVINHAQQVIVLVTGEGKASTLKRVMHERSANFPIQQLNNPNGIDWYLDAAAAAELT